jgi:hypothetical protein
LKNDPDFVKVMTKARKKPKPEERNLFQWKEKSLP